MTVSNAYSTRQIEMSPQEVAAALKSTLPPRLLDVRTPEEWELAHIDGTTLVTEVLAKEILEWKKDTLIVFYCHHGQILMLAAPVVINALGFSPRIATVGRPYKPNVCIIFSICLIRISNI